MNMRVKTAILILDLDVDKDGNGSGKQFPFGSARESVPFPWFHIGIGSDRFGSKEQPVLSARFHQEPE